jgi:hypothetical protein
MIQGFKGLEPFEFPLNSFDPFLCPPKIDPPCIRLPLPMSDLDCSICRSQIDGPTTGRVDLSCSHSFHLRCITDWFKTRPDCTCPLCRKAATESERLSEATPQSAPIEALLRRQGSTATVADFLLQAGTTQPTSMTRNALNTCLISLDAAPLTVDEFEQFQAGRLGPIETRSCEIADLNALLVANGGHGLTAESLALLGTPGYAPITFAEVEYIAFGNDAIIQRDEWLQISRPIYSLETRVYPVSCMQTDILHELALSRGGRGLPTFMRERETIWLSPLHASHIFIGNGAEPL